MLADQPLTAVGEREQLPVAKETSAETRKRAFTLFVRSYDQLRRAAVYLRWDEGDADAFVPSIYAGKKRTSELTPAPVPSAPGNGTPAPGVVPAVTAGPPAAGGAKEVPAGMPHSDPFLSKTEARDVDTTAPAPRQLSVAARHGSHGAGPAARAPSRHALRDFGHDRLGNDGSAHRHGRGGAARRCRC
jgi:hypothetical protein